jgi:hypothetical protein
MFKKTWYIYLLKKYIKWGVWKVAVCPSNIQDAQFLKVKCTSASSGVKSGDRAGHGQKIKLS